jgi:hydrogenase-1 operon protein HyaF
MTEGPVTQRMFGPGSQPADDETLDVLAMPREVSTFRMPEVPAAADALALVRARGIFEAFHAKLARWNPVVERDGPHADLGAVPADVLALVNQMLGEGEVSVRIAGLAGPEYRIQESVFTGLWRVCAFHRGAPVGDWIEAGPLPRAVLVAAQRSGNATLQAPAFTEGAMNSPAILAEIAAQMAVRHPKSRAHVVNLTLLPLTPEDHAAIDGALPAGPVAIVSRGFGHCRIESTLARDVWRVRYFNSMNTPILSTIEVVDLPEVALAAPEDLEDSRDRLGELISWLAE